MHQFSQPGSGTITSLPDLPGGFGSALASRRDRRLAGLLTGALVVTFSISVPYATRPLPEYPAFAPVYDMAVIVLDAITAFLLHAQYRQLGERSLLALACGYVFTPILMLAHALSFPDAFIQGEGFFGSSQTTAWLWVGWHGVFPLFVIAYALLVRGAREPSTITPGQHSAPSSASEHLALLATLALAAAAILLAAHADRTLPHLMLGSQYAARTSTVVTLGWVAHLVALGLVLARTRLRRRLDLWIAVTMVAWLLDLALSAVLVGARYQFGFYFGRLYGLLGASFVLCVLLRETLELYRAAIGSALRLKDAEAALRSANDGLEARVAERAAALQAEMRERRALALRLATAHEEERKHFARELHDSVGQLIAGLSFTFKAIETSGELPAAARAPLGEARRLADALSKEVHDLAVRLRPSALDDMGLEAALDQLVSAWSARTGVLADYATVGLANRRFSTEVESCVYRVVQEALTNAAKYARATRVGVVVTRPDAGLSVAVEDDGVGFDPDAVPHGRLGLLGMRERAALVGGTLNIESTPGAGCTVLLRIPALASEQRESTSGAAAGSGSARTGIVSSSGIVSGRAASSAAVDSGTAAITSSAAGDDAPGPAVLGGEAAANAEPAAELLP